MKHHRWQGFVVVVLLMGMLAGSAHAAFPGENGKILFSRDGDLWTMEPGGSSELRLTSTPDQETAARWSADGARIVLHNRFGGSHGISEDFSILDAHGGVLSRLEVPGDGENPAWSPDGARIAYRTLRLVCDQPSPVPCHEDLLGIRTIRTDGTDDREVSPSGYDPAWSPDGARIAYRAPRATGLGLDDVWVAGTDGSGPFNVTQATDSGSNTDLTPDWSPDGQRIVFVRVVPVCNGPGPCATNREVFSIKRDGTELRRLTFTDNDEFDPVSSPDGTKIAFNATNPNLSGFAGMFTMNPDGSALVKVSETARVEDWQALAPNQPPDCSAVRATPSALGAPNHRLVTVTLSGATDPDGDQVDLEITGVTQDEPVSGPPDAVATTIPRRVRLRAARDPHGDGRVYRIAFEATDGRGGTCTGFATASVRKGSRVPVDSAPPSYDSFGS